MNELLPVNASPLERAIDATDAARSGLPVDVVAASWDPATCPANLLGYLAWALSIDLWDESWPELKKRQVCARAFDLHAKKTTLAGIRDHIELAGAELRGVTRPPARGFLRTAVTDEARAAWLAALPHIQLLPFVNQATALNRWFFAARQGRRNYHGHGWLRVTRAPSLTGIHARFSQSGVEQVISVETDADGIARAFIPAVRPHRSWHGHGFGRGWLRGSRALQSVIAFRLDPAAGVFALDRGADPVAVAPARTYAGRTAPRHRSFFGRPLRFLQTSHAPYLVQDRIAVADPSIGIARRSVRSWHGHGRFGIRPFTAELKVAVPMRRCRRAFDSWHGRGFFKTPDLTPLSTALRAVNVSKAARDTILIDTASHSRAAFGSGMRFGDFTFGERVRNF